MAKNEMVEVLGIEQEIKDFSDKKKRKAYPVSMSDFPKFVEEIGKINFEKLWINYLFEEETQVALDYILKITFVDNELKELKDNINAGNFEKIMKIIIDINGIDLKKEEGDEKN